MSVDGGLSAFDRLRGHLDDVARRCPDCGYRDETGEWHAETAGNLVTYRRACPSCGAERVRQVRLG